jgi:membrane dipeptidase
MKVRKNQDFGCVNRRGFLQVAGLLSAVGVTRASGLAAALPEPTDGVSLSDANGRVFSISSTDEPDTKWPLLPGLSVAQRQRAWELHRGSEVIDVHDHSWRPQDYEDMTNGGVTAKIYKPLADGLYWDESNRRAFPADPFEWTAKYLEFVIKVEKLEKGGRPPVLIVRRLEDIARAKKEGKVGVILGNEGTLPLAGSAKTLQVLYQRGLREIALFWPVGGHTRHILDANGSLTQLGHEIIEKANELGIVLDSAHLAGSPAFWQVRQESKSPVLHTHGAAMFPRTHYFAEGDLEDKLIRGIADSGGVIGIHFCTYIKNLNGFYWSPTIDDLMDHVEYLIKVGGIDCVGIGADYFPYNRHPIEKPFMQTGNTRLEDMDWSKTFVVGLESISAMPLFTQALVGRGLSDEHVKKILGENVLRVLRQAWKG